MSSFNWREGTFKDFVVLLVSAFFMYTYNNIFMVVTPLLLTSMGGTKIIAGLQGTIFLVAAVILRFFFGPLADVSGRRLVMFLGSGAFFLAATMFLYAVEVWQVVVLRLIQAIGLAAYFPAALATSAACSGSEKRGTYIGMLRMIASLSLMVGPVWALNTIRNYGYFLLLRCLAIVAFLGLILLFFISGAVIGSKKQKIKAEEKKLLKRLNFLPLLRKAPLIVITTFLAALSYGIYITFAASFLLENTHIAYTGLFFTFFSIGGVLANVIFGWLSDRFGRLPLTICSVFSLGIGMILFALIPQINSLFSPAGFISGVGYYGSTSVLMAWMTEKVEAHEHAAALALQQNSLDFGIAFGGGVFGALLVTGYNDDLLCGIGGVLYLVYGMLFGLTLNSHSRLRLDDS